MDAPDPPDSPYSTYRSLSDTHVAIGESKAGKKNPCVQLYKDSIGKMHGSVSELIDAETSLKIKTKMRYRFDKCLISSAVLYDGEKR